MKRILCTSVGVVLLATVGCQTARMATPEDLTDADRLVVEGRQGWKISERLSFGPYTAIQIDRSWTKGRDESFRSYSGSRREQNFSFVLAEGDLERYGGSCRANLRAQTIETDIVDLQIRDRSELYCSLYPSREAARDWELRLEESGDRPLTGRLYVNGRVYDVSGTRKLAGGLPSEDTSGYTFRRGGRTEGAVEVMGNGVVMLSRTLDAEERALLATASTALLLAEDLRGRLEETSNQREVSE